MNICSKKVTIVIVTYNRKKLLKECIDALLQQNYKNINILVVNNNSSDGTEDYIKEYIDNKSIIYYRTQENLGGAGGFNFGIKKACITDCEYIWIMDDDCIVHSDSLEQLLNAGQKLNNNYGFLSSKVLWKDNSICKMNIPKKTFGRWQKDFNTPIQRIVMASFVSLFIKREIVEEIGLPIKEFFIWTDDWEYTRRISRKYHCYYVTTSVVTHKSANNIGADIATEDKERLSRFKFLYRNDVVLYRREGIKGWILLYLRLCKHVLRIYKSNLPDKKERINIIRNSIKEGKKFFPAIEYYK